MPCKGFMVSCFFWLPVLRKFVGRHNQLTVEIFDKPDRWSYGSLHRAVATLNWWGGRDFVVPRASKCIKNVIYLGRCFEGFCWWDLLMILCNEKDVRSIETNVSVWIWSRHSWLLYINEICKVHTMFITCSNMYTLTRCTIIVDALNSEKAPFHSPVETEGQAIVRGEGEDVATITIPWCLQVILKDHALQKLPVARKEKMEQTHDSTGRQLGKMGVRDGAWPKSCVSTVSDMPMPT